MEMLDEEIIRLIRGDIEIADDCMYALMKETNSLNVSKKYVKEKAEIAKRCLDFVLGCVNE